MIIINNFLAVNKEYFGKGLKAIDLLILSQVEEFESNDCICYMTDEQFMDITGEGKSAVRASLDRLEKKNIIIRKTQVVSGNGKANRQRIIRLQHNYCNAILNLCKCYVENNLCYIENQYMLC